MRYHGGKWLLAPWIISHFPEHATYVEPFGGAASVLLRKPRSHVEVYNEMSGDVVNLFRVLRNQEQAARLCELLELTPFAREEFRDSYEETNDPVERARRLVARSFMGFGSGSFNRNYSTGFRAASKQSNRPHAMDWANVPDSLWAVVGRMQGVTIDNKPALHVIEQQDAADTLFYLDPPYLRSTRQSSNCKQYEFEMSVNDHIDLLRRLTQVKGFVVISGYASDLYEAALKGWHRVEKTHYASGQVGKVERTEVLWLSPNIPIRQS